MKQLIVLCSTIFLGIAIYYMIMGGQDDSVVNSMADMWRSCIGIRNYTE